MSESPSIAAPPITCRAISPFFTALCATVTLLAALIAWGTRTPNSDLFMALAGGRDVAEGKLGQPDDWSFVTEGHIWINQSWLSGLGLYEIWRAGGETGLLATRAALIALLALGIIAWLRSRRISLASACLAVAVVLMADRALLTLRGNIVTVVATPWLIFFLERQRRGSIHWIWPIAFLLVIWTHCHGGFVYGLGIVMLWLVIYAPIRRAALSMKHWFILLTALLVVAALPIAFGPFKWDTYRQSFSMAKDSDWRTIREWWPLVRSWPELKGDWRDAFWEVGPFLICLGLIPLLAIFAVGKRIIRGRGSDIHEKPRWLFDAGLLGVTTYMAFMGRRFAPLAIVIFALPLAACIDYLSRRIRQPTAPTEPPSTPMRGPITPLAWIAACICLALAAAACYPIYVLGYSDRHPFYRPQSVFARQVMANYAPAGAVQFMQANNIDGNIVHEYSSEAYLRWNMPQAKVFCGGRAQQIYTETDLKRMRALLNPGPKFLLPPLVQFRNKRFFDYDVSTITLPATTLWELIVALNESQVWLPVYFDGRDVVLIRTVDKSGAPLPLFERFAAGRLDRNAVRIANVRAATQPGDSQLVVYPDEPAYLFSRALYLTSPWLTAGQGDLSPQRRAEMEEFIFKARRDAIEQALHAKPNSRLFDLLTHLANQRPEPRPDLGPFLQAELKRLEALPIDGADSADIYRCRISIYDALKRRAEEAGELEEAKQYDARSRAMLADLTKLARWWQF